MRLNTETYVLLVGEAAHGVQGAVGKARGQKPESNVLQMSINVPATFVPQKNVFDSINGWYFAQKRNE